MDLSHRFGLKSVKADLDYSIPGVAQTLPYFLGSLTVTGLIILVSSGFYLLQFYDPDPQGSHQSVLYIISRAPLGDFIRSIHFWSANFLLIVVTLHLLWVFWRGSYRSPRQFVWWVGVLMLGTIFLLHFTGMVLPQDQAGYEAMAHFVAGARGVGPVGSVFTPEFTPTVEVSSRLYGFHVGILPVLLFGFLGFHLYLIRVLGIHTHPGEDAQSGRFLFHIRRVIAHGFFFLALAGIFALVWPAELGYPAIEGAEVTKPPFFFLWIYALENWFGIHALVFGSPIVYLLLFLPPIIDRQPSTLPRDRIGILSLGFGVILLLLVLATYAWIAPAQQHLM